MLHLFNLITRLFLVNIFFNIKTVRGCSTSIKGASWSFEWGVDEEIPGIQSVDLCQTECQQDVVCQGYTWRYNGIVGYCYKFNHELSG